MGEESSRGTPANSAPLRAERLSSGRKEEKQESEIPARLTLLFTLQETLAMLCILCLTVAASAFFAVDSLLAAEPTNTSLAFDISFADWPVEPPAAVAQNLQRHNADRKSVV